MVQRNVGKYDRGASKDVYKIITGDESRIYVYEPETKQQSIESEPNPTKVVCGKIFAPRCKRSPVSSAKVVMCRLLHLNSVGHLIQSGTLQVVCLQTSQKFEKRTREDESLFIMAMRAHTYWLKTAPF